MSFEKPSNDFCYEPRWLLGLLHEPVAWSDKECDEHEERVRINPDDIETRMRLLGFYFLREYENEIYPDRRQSHMIWLIENLFENPLFCKSVGLTNDKYDRIRFAYLRNLWRKVLAEHQLSYQGWANFAFWITMADTSEADEALATSERLNPQNSYLSSVKDFLNHQKFLESRKNS